MSNVPVGASTPGRPPVKVTYLERQKRKNDSSSSDKGSKGLVHSSPETSSKPLSKALGTKYLRKKSAEFIIPEAPSSRKANGNSTLTSDVASTSFSSPSRLSTSNLRNLQTLNRGTTPETEVDDNASIADSIASVSRVRRTEAERIVYFENQLECGKIEPHRAFCKRCSKFVKLGNKQTYTVRTWVNHRTRCDKKPPSTLQSGVGVAINDFNRAPSVEPSASEAEGTPRRTEAERKAILESDTRAEEVEPDKARCRKCQKWIRLSQVSNYKLTNWNNHQLSCSGASTSNKVIIAERKLRFLNDMQAKSFSSRNVECAICETHVTLEGELDYDAQCWVEHKKQCLQPHQSGIAKETNSILFPTSSTNHAASTEEPTLQGRESSLSPGKGKGVKRLREDEDEVVALDDDTDERRPLTRPRTEGYEPAIKDEPGPFGWFTLPFKAFIRGFRESLRNDTAS